MKLSEIAGLMRGAVDPEAFRRANGQAFDERSSALTKVGSVVPVRVEEDTDVDVSTKDIATLCRLFMRGAINAVELAYIADALQLADRAHLHEDSVADYLAEFTDPEINGEFTTERARGILNELPQHT